MLLSARAMMRNKLAATDDEFGRLSDQYIDDREWAVRYFVADTGTWLPGRLVLVSPVSVRSVDQGKIVVDLTKEQIEGSPSIEEAKPISRQHEEQLTLYYGWPQYWIAARDTGISTAGSVAGQKGARGEERAWREDRAEMTGDPALRSVNAITGYHIQAVDGEIGHLEDLLLDEDGWFVRYLIIDTRNWLPGKKVLLLPGMIDEIDWTERKVFVPLDRDTIKNAPEFDPGRPVTRDLEEELLAHYDVPVYW